MKKTLFLAVILFVVTGTIHAQVVHKVKVSNYQFSPKTVNAVVGDKIKWVWVNGGHTTTSTSVPTNASTWNKPINKNNLTFTYTVRKAGTYKYRCNFHFSLGMVGTIKVTNALASGLNGFTVENGDANALLNWKTQSSKDVAYFSVQRSTDGDNFNEIGRVAPDLSNQYKFTDNNNTSSKYVYYQIEMIDAKGEHQLSEIKMYTQKAATSKLIMNISPNPISNPGHLMLQFNADKEGTLVVQLYNQSGTFITQTQMAAYKGLNNGHFHLGDLTPGAYYIVCTLGQTTEKHTIIVK